MSLPFKIHYKALHRASIKSASLYLPRSEFFFLLNIGFIFAVSSHQYLSWLQFYLKSFLLSLQYHVPVLSQRCDRNDPVPAVLNSLIYLNLASITRMVFSSLTPPFRLIILSLTPHSISSFFLKTKARHTFILQSYLYFKASLSFLQSGPTSSMMTYL